MSAEDGGWDLGGYVPVAYEVTPWATLFPQLVRFASSSTLKAGYVAKMYTYYLTRLQFAQYLRFLADVGETICGNDVIDQDVQTYQWACDTLRSEIDDAARARQVNADTYTGVVAGFEGRLDPTGRPASQRFYSGTAYATFFAKYPFFTGCAYGFMVCDAGRYLSVRAENMVPDAPLPTSPVSLLHPLADARRFYPVLTREGGVTMTFYDDAMGFIDKLRDGPSESTDCYVHDLPEQLDSSGLRYVAYQPRYHGNLIWNLKLYPIGLMDVPNNYTGAIRGVPMLSSMPFDFLSAFAAGDHHTHTVIGPATAAAKPSNI